MFCGGCRGTLGMGINGAQPGVPSLGWAVLGAVGWAELGLHLGGIQSCPAPETSLSLCSGDINEARDKWNK